MGTRRLYRQNLAVVSLLTIGLLILAGVVAGRRVRDSLVQQQEATLRTISDLALRQLPSDLFDQPPSALDHWARQLSVETGSGIQLFAPDGRRVAGSGFPAVDRETPIPAPGEAARFEPGGSGSKAMATLTLRLRGAGDGGALRVGLSNHTVREGMQRYYRGLLWVVLVSIPAAALVALYLTRRTDRQFSELARRIDKLETGNLLHPLPYLESDVSSGVISSLNQSLGRWQEEIRGLAHRCAEQDALLASMVEGVIAIDPEERIISLNPAAGHLLGIDPGRALHRKFPEVSRQVKLSRFAAAALRSDAPVEDEVWLSNSKDRCLRAVGTMLRDSGGRRSGALIVLEDVTHLRRLETVRRDFVANVSHELKTPITSIKGFAETLEEGALDRPEEARRFIGIILKQSNRLQAIIEDLLALSRIEHGSTDEEIDLTRSRIGEILELAVQTCRPAARAKKIEIRLTCDPGLQADVNAPLLEQALVNLIDNAVKYSESGKPVRVTARTEASEIVIEVRDEGAGIDPKHLGRLFERFYRVDKARSRKLGGTGLGLAIVKHIALAHHGDVSVESVVGEGSTFRIHLPFPAREPGNSSPSSRQDLTQV